jgi:hypothetical protein
MVRHDLLAKIGQTLAAHEREAAPPRSVSERHRDHAAVSCARLWQLSAEPGPHQRRTVADGDTTDE